MSFDPYDEWLGIPPHRQPPTPADLLGLPEEEADVDRIREAAGRRYEHVKRYTLAGPLSADANRLLDEISQALKYLTDPGRIESLRLEQAQAASHETRISDEPTVPSEPPGTTAAEAPAMPSPLSGEITPAPSQSVLSRPPARRKRPLAGPIGQARPSFGGPVLGVAAAAAVVILAVWVWGLMRWMGSSDSSEDPADGARVALADEPSPDQTDPTARGGGERPTGDPMSMPATPAQGSRKPRARTSPVSPIEPRGPAAEEERGETPTPWEERGVEDDDEQQPIEEMPPGRPARTASGDDSRPVPRQPFSSGTDRAPPEPEDVPAAPVTPPAAPPAEKPAILARLRGALQPHTGAVTSIAFSSDGAAMATGGTDRTLAIWDVNTAEIQMRLEDQFTPVDGVAFGQRKTQLVSAGGTEVKFWNMRTRRPATSWIVDEAAIYALAFHPRDQIVATAGGNVNLWDLKKRKLLVTLFQRPRPEPAPAETMFSGSTEFPGRARPTPTDRSKAVRSVCFSSDGSMVAAGGGDATVQVWHAYTTQLLMRTVHPDPVNSVAFKPNGSILAVADDQGAITLYDPAQEQQWSRPQARPQLLGHKRGVWAIAYRPDGSILASASADRTLSLWDADSGELRQTLTGHLGEVRCLAFDPSGQILASGASDGTVAIWNLAGAGP